VTESEYNELKERLTAADRRKEQISKLQNVIKNLRTARIVSIYSSGENLCTLDDAEVQMLIEYKREKLAKLEKGLEAL
jgi:hypothetical protein